MPRIIPRSPSSGPVVLSPAPARVEGSPAARLAGQEGALAGLSQRQSAAGLSPRAASTQLERLRAPAPPRGAAPAPIPPRNVFEQNPEFEKVNDGDPANGIVVHLPQRHWDAGLTWEHDEADIMKTASSQAELLATLEKYRPAHIVSEAAQQLLCDQLGEFEVLDLQPAHLQAFARGVARTAGELAKTTDAVALRDTLGRERLADFLSKFDAGMAYAITMKTRSVVGQPRLHAPHPPEFQGRLEAAQANFGHPQAMAIVFGEREAHLAGKVSKVLAEHPGEPVFVVFGGAHDLSGQFPTKADPALYRFRSQFARPEG